LRGRAAIADAAMDHALCIGDQALAADGAERGLSLEAPTPSVVTSVTVAALTAVWGHRAGKLACADSFVAFVRACCLVQDATIEPRNVMFVGGSNNRHYSPISCLLRTDMADDIAGFSLAVHPKDAPVIADIFARRQLHEARAFDMMYVGLKRRPANVARLLEHLHGVAFVPDLIRIHDGEICAPDDSDVKTMAAALELVGRSADIVRVGDVHARSVSSSAAAHILDDHVEPIRVELDDPPAGSKLTADWLGYVFAATDALLGRLPDAYTKMLGLTSSTDPAVRDHALRAAARIMPHLSSEDFERLTT
jgi:hypothetical protein